MANKNNNKKNRMPAFLEALKKSLGIVQPACDAVGIARSTYNNWYNSDPKFAKQVEEIIEIQLDFVENKLIRKIREDDISAIIFYLKTKGKKRGYVEKQEMAVVQNTLNNPFMGLSFKEIQKLYKQAVKDDERK